MFLSRSTERQAGNDGKTVDSQQQQKKANNFFVYFLDFVHISRVFIFANDV